MLWENGIIKKRILIFGSNGMLGQRLTTFYKSKKDVELLASSAEETSFFPEVDYRKVNIVDKNQVKKIIYDFYPDFIINAAAFTNVDACETQRELAWKINVVGVSNIANYAWTCDAHLIHISSDYVFDGENGPYTEKDKVNPISYYGRTKLASENVIIGSGVKNTIIRPNVLYGPAKYGRPDFVKWVVNSLKNNKPIRIVTDQFNNPTYLDDLVSAIASIIEFKREGVYHIGGSELLSRYDFTIRIADYFKLNKDLITPITTPDLNQPARRPLKSGLITLKAETEFGYSPRNIEETLYLMEKELGL